MRRSSMSWVVQLLAAVFVGAVVLAGLPIVLAWLQGVLPLVITLALVVGIVVLAVGGFRRRW